MLIKSRFLDACILGFIVLSTYNPTLGVVYLNGAEWYITLAQEKYSGKYFQEEYGVDDDNVIIVKAGWIEVGEEEDIESYQVIYDCLNAYDMSKPESYDILNRIMDIQSYIDFSCVNVYFGNLDYNEQKNVICWRAKKTGQGRYEDGRWRWALYDMDLENLAYGVRVEDINTFTMGTRYAGGAFNTRPMYMGLKQNPRFCRQFVLSFMDMVNTDFTVQRATEVMEEWGTTLEWWGIQPEWTETFFPARTKAVTGHLAEEFGLTGSCEELKLSINDPKAGRILLNTIEPGVEEGEWNGIYFTDYPVTVIAVANTGYRFAGWQVGTQENMTEENIMTVQIPTGGLALRAIFEKE